MNIKIYRILFIIFLSLTFIVSFSSLGYSLYDVGKGNNTGDLAIFLLSNIVLIALNGYQIFSIIISFKKGGSFMKGFLIDDKDKINKKTIIVINTFLLIILGLFIYSILLLSGLDVPLNTIAKPISYLAMNFFLLLMIDFIFMDLYLLVYKEDN